MTTVARRRPDREPSTGDAPSAADSTSVALALDTAGVPWAMLRGAEAAGRAGRDLDLLVAPEALATAVDALRAAGFTALPRTEPAGRSLVRRNGTAARPEAVDLGTALAFGPVPRLVLADAATVLARVERLDGIPRPAPRDRFWLLALHAVLDHDGAEDRHRAEVADAAAAASPDDELAAGLDASAGAGTAAGVLDAARRGTWEAFDARVRGAHARVAGRRVPLARAAARARRIGRRLPSMLARPGLSVAIIGPDGAGKSSLVRDVPGRLPVPVRTRYLGLFGAGHRRARVRGLGFALRLARLWAGVVSDALDLARGRIVVYDRYPYDMLRARAGESRGRAVRRRIEAHAAPPPDLVIFLDAPAEVLHRRRPEHTVAELTGLLEHYRSIAGGLRDVVVLDATAPRETVLRRASDEIWRRYRLRAERG